MGRQSLVSPEADVATPPLGAAATALLSAPAPSPTLSAATPAPAASTSEVSTPEVPPAVAPTPASGGATATVIPTPDARQRVALVRALLQSASGVKGNVRQDFTQQLDDLQQKMAAGKTREARDRAQQLLRRTTDAARKRDLDPSLAAQMAAQLQALAGQLG